MQGSVRCDLSSETDAAAPKLSNIRSVVLKGENGKPKSCNTANICLFVGAIALKIGSRRRGTNPVGASANGQEAAGNRFAASSQRGQQEKSPLLYYSTVT